MSNNDICKEAYYLWEAQGRPAGRDQEFWFQAEMLLKSRLVPQLKAATPNTSKTAPKAPSNGTTKAAAPQSAKTVKRPRKVKV